MKYVAVAIIVALVIFFFIKSASNKKAAEANLEIGKQFLIENKLSEEVIETDSGLQYTVMQKGDGQQRPTASSTVKVHYHGTLLDGTVFDSSVERGEPISFPLNRVIKGWTEGVQLMVVGDKFKFFIPAELAYGNKSAGSIEPGSTLVFEVELLGIE
ncbi:FKBP-type peptidyl-prolyl cis-trans isomerase [Glaciecola sp. XM2]|jgi:peptidylprolyl isomerase|uniref:FKBP-type peptidyl-prolyl cis-trans isomerase n=1 Tax=Glaciecola sp. XM2 TaxID=1914931 RepID=UPI001BDE6D0B|nr:FKBP-type peptidyl-prolyl cis-trans isomerase [Glaciecola sp. XM2]MBT1450153.1 FKBP-type peptidyl-prolyl cis-trans isomerase [Glaciecola sp. XM2]